MAAALLAGAVFSLAAPGPRPAAGEDGAAGAGAPSPGAAAAPVVLEETGDEWAEGGVEACTTCHDDAATLAILKTPHAMKGDRRTPFANLMCAFS